MRVHYGVDYVENSIANRRNRFVNRYGEISVSNVVLIRFVCFTRILVAFVLLSVCCIDFPLPCGTVK